MLLFNIEEYIDINISYKNSIYLLVEGSKI